MHLNFDEIAPESRIWIYQSDRKLDSEEVTAIEEKIQSFLEGWRAHGKPLKSASKIFYHQFLVIAVDDQYNAVSGCSIDESVHFIEALGRQYHTNFLDRKPAFFQKDEVTLIDLPDVRTHITRERIKDNIYIFNNLITNKKQLENEWIIHAGDSWLKKYF